MKKVPDLAAKIRRIRNLTTEFNPSRWLRAVLPDGKLEVTNLINCSAQWHTFHLHFR